MIIQSDQRNLRTNEQTTQNWQVASFVVVVFALFLFGFPNLKQKMAAGARGHAPPRGPRYGGDARGVPHPGATRSVALPGSARPRGKTPVIDARLGAIYKVRGF